MENRRRAAVIVGVLFLAAYVGIFAGGALSAPLSTPDARVLADPGVRARSIAGLVAELVLNDAAIIAIAALMFPVFRRFGEGAALALLGVRIAEAAMLAVGAAGAASLLALPGDSVPGLAPALLAFRHWSGKLSTAFFVIGAFLFYALLLRSRLVPRFLSLWGLFAAACLAAANIVGIPDLTQDFEVPMLLYFPIVLSELLTAVWFIAKGWSEPGGLR